MNEYKKEIDNMRWSYSRLTAFENCPYGFYLKYILDDEERTQLGYIAENNYYAEVGSFVHKILEMFLNKKLTPDEVLPYYINHFEENVCCAVSEKIMNKTYELCADYFSALDLNWLKEYEIVGVEVEHEFKIAGYRFIGFIDLLLKDLKDGKYIIVDHKSAKYPLTKSGSVKRNLEKCFREYKRQMYLYSYIVKEKYGVFPKEIKWNHFKDNKTVSIPFNQEDYDDAIKWFVDTIKRIEDEQEFQANKDFFFCHNLCDFRRSCEYVELNKPNEI